MTKSGRGYAAIAARNPRNAEVARVAHVPFTHQEQETAAVIEFVSDRTRPRRGDRKDTPPRWVTAAELKDANWQQFGDYTVAQVDAALRRHAKPGVGNLIRSDDGHSFRLRTG